MFRDLLAGLITGPWERIASQVSKEFDLDALPPPVDMRQSNASKPGKFGGWLDDDCFVLCKECMKGIIPHEGVLAREYMRKVLDEEGFEETVKDDFSLAFGALCLSHKYHDVWYQQWQEYCPFKGDETTGLFIPSSAFELFHTFSGSEYFNKLLKEYILMKRNGLQIDEPEYVLHMLERLRRFSVQLTPTDFSLIRRLLETPEASRSDLADETNKTLPWVSRRLVTLQSHGVLRHTREVMYPRIGMAEKILFLNSDEESSILDFIIESPFLHFANRIVAGEYDVVAVLLVPDNAKNLRSLDTYKKILQDNDIDSVLLDITAYNTNRCFDHYSSSTNRWEMPWELFVPHLRRIYDDELYSVMAPNMLECSKAKIPLSTLDLEIIHEFKLSNPYRIMRKNLAIKYERMMKRIEALKEAAIIKENYELHHCGLNEVLMVQIPTLEFAEAISSWAQRLPMTRSMRVMGDEGLMHLQLPDGGLQGMALVLQSLSPSLKPMLLDPHTMHGKWYASNDSWIKVVRDLWDEDAQRWSDSSDEILHWFSSLS